MAEPTPNDSTYSRFQRRFRLAVNTGGGDAPGLNAVIRAVVMSALNLGWEVVGIRQGYDGLLNGDGIVTLDEASVQGITHLGGTILGTTNRGNPLRYPEEQPDGSVKIVDRSDEIVQAFRDRHIDALVAIGGDGSLHIASQLSARGLPVVGVPKTIDNDLAATAVTFGFHTAVQTATEAIDKLHSTAQSHERIMVVELMGRHTGWIALFAGVTGTADAILIPETPYDLKKVAEHLRRKYQRGPRYAIVVVAEGAKPKGGEVSLRPGETPGNGQRYGGLAERVGQELEELTGFQTRSLVLGHLQRGGQPTAYDRLLALRFGSAAVDVVERGDFGCMVALDPPDVKAVPLEEAIRDLKRVSMDGDVVRTARHLGISFGD
ncbi:MAG: ATP-dependent 6-phosphofructokinase [Gemmatimonadales bacterium]|nr:MAG: ATP-dependent 6-phosphofructokinase [Gemmatimonadales bacterium]